MIAPSPFYLVIDLETTCANNGRIPVDDMETIEIGAVMVAGDTLAIADEFQSFVRPVRRPMLTPFCMQLTHITQVQVEGAPGFARALRHLTAWASRFNGHVFCSWGNFDREQLRRDCDHHRVPYPFGDRHINLKHAFERWLGGRQEVTLNAALQACGLSFDGAPHRGIDDARNTARVLAWMVRRT